MELKLSDIERELVRQSLLDTIVNSENFNRLEKDFLKNVYHRIRDFEEENEMM